MMYQPDPDVVPPLMTPLLHGGTQIIDEREWQGSTWREEEKIMGEKGILGPGPVDFRYSDTIKPSSRFSTNVTNYSVS